MKIGVFGGTFDPVHQGHIALVETAMKELSLDMLYVMPNGNPPHKDRETDKLNRLEMVKAAYEAVGMRVVFERRKGEWFALVLKHKA